MTYQNVVVVTDSGAALPVGAQSAYRIVVVPLHLTIDGEPFLEGVNISPPRVVAALMAGEKVTVQAPTAAEFTAAYAKAVDEGATSILSIHMSARMHGVVSRAAEAAEGTHLPVKVIDTRTVAMAQALVVLSAAAVARTGGSPERAETEAAITNAGARMLLTVASLDFLHRDGQVPGALKAISNVTKMRPILSVVDGEVKMVSRVRGTGAARLRVRDDMVAYCSTLRRPAVAASLVGGSVADEGLAIDLPGALSDVSPGASLTAHAGPGTYAVAVAPMPDEYLI